MPTQEVQCCNALEYSSAMDRLAFADHAEEQTYLYDQDNAEWTTLSWGVTGSGATIHNIMEYDPVTGAMYFGGGYYDVVRELFKMDAEGVTTALPTPPIDLGIAGAARVHTFDPISGDFLVFTPGGETHVLDRDDTWSQSESHPLGYGDQMLSAVAAKIPEYGVTMVVSHYASHSVAVYLYKHSPSTIDLTPPAAPRGLRVVGQ